MYLLVDWMRIDKIISYIIVYSISYILEYALTLGLVFKTGHHWSKVIKFMIHTLVFLFLGTMVFTLLLGWQMQYLIATLSAAILLLPLRYLSNKFFVYI
jgi:putative flippase GtrA